MSHWSISYRSFQLRTGRNMKSSHNVSVNPPVMSSPRLSAMLSSLSLTWDQIARYKIFPYESHYDRREVSHRGSAMTCSHPQRCGGVML